MFSPESVWLLVGLLVFKQDYTKTSNWISMKQFWRMGNGFNKNPLNSGANPDLGTDSGFSFSLFNILRFILSLTSQERIHIQGTDIYVWNVEQLGWIQGNSCCFTISPNLKPLHDKPHENLAGEQQQDRRCESMSVPCLIPQTLSHSWSFTHSYSPWISGSKWVVKLLCYSVAIPGSSNQTKQTWKTNRQRNFMLLHFKG